ncbi:DoxX family protein [Photobacterium sp. OFAV2-7]|nr:DoxX family protein [Photobacterium sp. OFAV2-7]MCG7585575.1 DoxX family protein [Photobacterium sp. OFAV2-7]
MNAVTGLLSVFFIFASSIKLFGWQKMIFEKQLAFFHSYGFNRQFMFLVGLAELFGAIAIWFQGSLLGVLGALALAGTSLGAIVCHLRFDTWKDGIPAMVTLLLSSMVVYFSSSLL